MAGEVVAHFPRLELNMKTTAIIPFWNGPNLDGLLDDLGKMPAVIVVDYGSAYPVFTSRDNVQVVESNKRGYFAGTVNRGVEACNTDTLILNQDVRLVGSEWMNFTSSEFNPIYGDGVFKHPAWKEGYIQGTYMFISRDAWNTVGKLNELDYPLWGCTAEWQLRAVRKKFNVQPMDIPGLKHEHRTRYQVGSAIAQAVMDEPNKKNLFFQTPPAITVVIPCYNYGRYLQDAIDSLMAQTFQSFEVIIVDDTSTDDSWEVCKSFHNPKAGIRSIQHRSNLGTAATLNTAIKNSYGQFITVLSADDMYMPDRIEKLYRASLAYPDSVIYDDIIWRTPKGDIVKKMREYYFDNLVDNNEPGLLFRNVMHAGIMYPRKAWKETGGYPNIMRDGREDWAFNIALGRAGYCGVHLQEPLYIYRREKQNRSLTNTTPYHHGEFLRKLNQLFPDVYSGRFPMGCCGGRGTSRSKKATRSTRKTKGEIQIARTDGYVELRYVGKNVGTQTWYGRKTGNVYKFGLTARRQNGFVHPDDKQALLDTKEFIEVKHRPSKPAKIVKIKPEPQEDKLIVIDKVDKEEVDFVKPVEPKQDKVESEIVEYEPDATSGAKKFADEIKVDLIEVDGDIEEKEQQTRRITKKDVENYARRTGAL